MIDTDKIRQRIINHVSWIDDEELATVIKSLCDEIDRLRKIDYRIAQLGELRQNMLKDYEYQLGVVLVAYEEEDARGK